MIANWMLYCLAVGALVTLGALAMERAMRAFCLPQRWVWAAALVLSLAIPAAARWLPRAPQPAPAAAPDEVTGRRMRLADFPAAAADDLSAFDAAALDRPLTLGWAGMSGAAALALLGAAVLLERRRRRWRAMEVDGVPVLLSPDTGPAVVGLFRSRIVLPAWVMDADADERALLLEHEREHVRAGDPRLLALGLLAVAAAPWSPAAWFQLRRLRLAMEVDCDARVLARRADVRAYGTLLLEVGRRGTGGRLAAAAFSEPVSFLERRIRIMTSPRARFPWLRAAGFGAVAVTMIVAACEAPGPLQTSPTAAGTRMEPVRSETAMVTEARASGVRISRAAIDAAVREHYPEVFSASAADTTMLMFMLNEAGEVQRHERMQMRRMGAVPTDAAQRETMMSVRMEVDSRDPDNALIDLVTFAPGQMGPGRVEVIWVRELGDERLVTNVVVDTLRVPAGEQLRTPAATGERIYVDEMIPTPAGAAPTGERITIPVDEMRAERVPEASRMRTPAPAQAQPSLITAEQARGYVERYMPQVARNGTDQEFVWFMADAGGAIVRHGDTRTSEALNAQVNDLENVQVFKGESIVINGHPIPVIYARLKS